MRPSRSLLSATVFCEHCQKDTKFLPIHFARAITSVSRSTIYYWMERDWIHWRELPSGRRIICLESLTHQARKLAPDLTPLDKISPKLFNAVQSGKLTRR
jgi:hypothetical protein